MNSILVLSIDGGGFRGIIPAIVLEEIEKRLVRKGIHKPFHRIFDLMAGTSSGGLIVLALCVPRFEGEEWKNFHLLGGVKPKELVNLYMELGKDIFPHLFKPYTWFKQLSGCKYSVPPLEQLLGKVFMNTTTQQALTNILIASFDISAMEPLFIRKRLDRRDSEFFMRDAALAATAVPTYYPPAEIKALNFPNKSYCLIDGGVFCINPALSAYFEARSLYPRVDRQIILSLGTGMYQNRYTCQEARSWGIPAWINPGKGMPIAEVVGGGQSTSTTQILKEQPDVDFFRFDITLEKGRGRMDDTRTNNIHYMVHKAYELIHNQHDEIDRFCAMVDNELMTRKNI